jgi:hypothetical protein
MIHMFNLPTKIAAACAGLSTAGGVGLALGSPANASPQSDFFGCLRNHNVTWDNDVAMNNLGVRIQYDLQNGLPVFMIENNLINYWNTTRSIAHVDVMCAQATLLMGAQPGGESA